MYNILINPASRSGKGFLLWEKIVEPYLIAHHIEYTPYFSPAPGEVSSLMKRILELNPTNQKITIIILGGDGTVNEAIQGIIHHANVIIGYIPTGSSNDLARSLKIPKDPIKALELILHTGTIHAIDLGFIRFPNGESRKFVVSSGIGFDAAVCEETNHSLMKIFLNKLGLGKLAYLGIALKQIITAKPSSCEITVDHASPIIINKILFVASMIHKYEGGGFQFCPNASYTDGTINLCTVGDIPTWLIILALPTAFFGKHYMISGITAYEGKEIHIKTSSPLWIHTDGEVIMYGNEFQITCFKFVPLLFLKKQNA